MVCKRALRTGDGTWNAPQRVKAAAEPVLRRCSGAGAAEPMPLDSNGNVELVNMDYDNMLWGWNDKDLPDKAKQFVEIRNKQE